MEAKRRNVQSPPFYPFDERCSILQERFPEAQKKFFSTLRQDAYIKISDTYRPLVAPILYAEERKEKTVSEK